jgi:DNA-binding transcriptional ArsR family regulator
MASRIDDPDLPGEWADELPVDCRKALSHPMRREILRVLVRDVQSLSPVEVARTRIVPCSITAAVYHVEVLAYVGLVERVDTEPVEGTFERFFSAADYLEPLVYKLLDATQVGDRALLATPDS